MVYIELNKKLTDEELAKKLHEDYTIYQEILNDYSKLNSDDYDFAYNIAQRAKVHADRIAELVAFLNKYKTDKEHTADAIKCRISIEHDEKNTSKGNRFAGKDKEYLDALAEYTTARKTYEYLSKVNEILDDINYQCFTIYDTANKKAIK